MSPRLGLRSRILALTMPVVLLVSAAIAGMVYLSLGQVLEASARDIASAEARELRADLRLHSIEDLSITHVVDVSTRVSQVVDDGGHGGGEDRRVDRDEARAQHDGEEDRSPLAAQADAAPRRGGVGGDGH